MKQKINIIVGPTASGKSSFGLRLAEKIKGEIINADSMQIYQDLKILSARPLESEMNGITHYLYGYLGSHEKNSAYDWLKKAIQIIQKIEKNSSFFFKCSSTTMISSFSMHCSIMDSKSQVFSKDSAL